jgi:hypothetical protein
VARRFHPTKTHSLQTNKFCSRYGGTDKMAILWQAQWSSASQMRVLRFLPTTVERWMQPLTSAVYSPVWGTGQPVGVPSSSFQWNVKFKCAVNAINFCFFILLYDLLNWYRIDKWSKISTPNWSTCTHNLNLGNTRRWRRVVSFTPPPLFLRRALVGPIAGLDAAL